MLFKDICLFVGCFVMTIIILAVPTLCVLSFLLGWHWFWSFMLIMLTICDTALVLYNMGEKTEN